MDGGAGESAHGYRNRCDISHSCPDCKAAEGDLAEGLIVEGSKSEALRESGIYSKHSFLCRIA